MALARIVTLTVVASLVALGAATAQVAYLPLAQDNTWTYVTPGGVEETRLVTGQIPLFDQDVWVVEHPVSDENLDLENYWTEGADGDVLLHGWMRSFGGYAYDPPVVMADAPLEPGRTWTTTFDVYSLPEMEYLDTYTLEFAVLESGTIEVPAGSFEAFGVGGVEPPLFAGRGERYSLAGELAGPAQREVGSWWSLGVGEVQFTIVDTYQLQSYQVSSVAVQSRTWSGVKSLFD